MILIPLPISIILTNYTHYVRYAIFAEESAHAREQGLLNTQRCKHGPTYIYVYAYILLYCSTGYIVIAIYFLLYAQQEGIKAATNRCGWKQLLYL